MRALDFLLEIDGGTSIPKEPGTQPIPPGTVRLYHQTTESSLRSIMRTGLNIAHARGIEGPRAIYASRSGFYGKPDKTPTVEFYVPMDKWDDPFVLQDVPPENIIAGHLPWHSKARYILNNPGTMEKAMSGEFDDLGGDYARAVSYVKREHGSHGNQTIAELFEPQSAFELEWDTSSGPREIHAEAYDRQGRSITISFVPSGGNLDVVDIEFTRGGSHGITGKGDASMVLGTVLSAITTYLNKHHRPDYITFLGKEGSRRGVYQALVSRMGTSLGYEPVDMKNLPPEFGDDFFLSSDGVFLLRNSRLSEDWKTKAAAVGLGTAMALGGIGKYAIDKEKTAQQQTQQVTKTQPKPEVKKPAPKKSLTPAQKREQVLKTAAETAGMKGDELNQFMSQAAHETLNFMRLTEIGSDKYLANRYDKKFSPKRAKLLGNTDAGDGVKYKGRGYLQITGRYNYAKAGKALGLDLEDNPQLLEDPEIAAQVSIWYWNARVKPKVSDFSDVKKVTKHINPGMKGIDDRLEKFAKMTKDTAP